MKALFKFRIACVLLTIPFFIACRDVSHESGQAIDLSRIVSLNGTLTEIFCELGLEKNIVGVDVSSNYPAAILKLPKAGHNRNVNTEAVLAMNPSVIFAMEGGLKPEAAGQFKTAKVPVVFFKQDHSIDGAKRLIKDVADTLQLQNRAPAIYEKLETDIAAIPKYNTTPKVLFIYARGAGNMSVCGSNTAIAKMIALAGGENAASDLEDFKPYSSEVLVQRNPDVLLFFDSGLESLDGIEGLLNMPGVMQTNAGKNKKIVTMDGHLLSGFSPRLGLAIAQLSKLIHE